MSNISILGSGLVGSLLGVMLHQKGHAVTLFEKRPEPDEHNPITGRSINLILTSRGLHALDQIGLKKKALDISVPVYGRVIHAVNGNTVYQPYGQSNECNFSISRWDLNLFLINECKKLGLPIYFDHDLKSVDLRKKTLEFLSAPTDGSQKRIVPYEVLFGTDGAGSVVRKSLCENEPDKYSESTTWLEADYKELFINKNSGLRKNALHIWPRGSIMMMALENLDGSWTVTLYMPKSGEPSFSSIKNPKDLQSLFEKYFPDALSLIHSLEKDFFANPQGALGTVRFNRWHFDNSVFLLGDAAHAIVPFFGQGMNSGFEDCTALWEILPQTHNPNWANIFENLFTLRKPNADAIADMALENWVEMKEKVADPKFLLRKQLENTLEQKFPAVFKSRYGLITYTLTSYKMAQSAGNIQAQFLEPLVQAAKSLEDISESKLESFIHGDWSRFCQDNNLKIKNYDP